MRTIFRLLPAFQTTAHRYAMPALYGLSCLVIGGLVGLLMPSIVNQSFYRLVMIVLAICVLIGLLITRAPGQTFAVFLLIGIPLNLSFTPFGEAPWHSGGAQSVQVIYLYDLPLLGLIVFWLLEGLLTKRVFRILAVEVVSLIFIGWGLLSLQNSTDPNLTIMEVIRMIKLLLLGHIVGSTITSRAVLNRMVAVVVLGLVVQSLLSILQYAFDVDLGGIGFVVGDVRRVSGSIGWPNTLGAYAAAVLCLPIAMWMALSYSKYRLVLTALIIIGSVPLALSFSRGAWVGLAVAVVVMYGLSLKQKIITLRGFWAQMIVLAVIILVAGMLLAEQISDRASEDTLSVRAYLNEIALTMAKAEPVLGIGLNTFVPAMRAYDTRNVYAYFPEPVHNIFLLTVAETGIVGLALYLASIILAVRIAWSLIRQSDKKISAIAIGLVGAIVSLIVSNLTDVHLRTDVIYAMWWVFIGLLLGTKRLMDQDVLKVVSAKEQTLRLWHENSRTRLWT